MRPLNDVSVNGDHRKHVVSFPFSHLLELDASPGVVQRLLPRVLFPLIMS